MPPTMKIHFPPLSPEMLAHNEAVLSYLREELQKAGGVISFARYMELALYAPGLGYYSSGSHKLGKRGDFVTAPEISPLFAKCLARQFIEILKNLPEGNILELGAGAGTFAKDVLLELEQAKRLPAHYFILETSADLRERQKHLLEACCPHLLSRVLWLDRLPENFKGIIFANEVLDALPFHCFRIENNTIKERCVTLQEGQLDWIITDPLTPELKKSVEPLMAEFSFPEEYESEINLLMPHWIKTLADILQEGVIVLFDYGFGRREYYHPERTTGTLRCYFQHRCHADPFLYAGLQDITANVEFTTLVESAFKAGLDLAGYTTQSSFLLDCSVTDFATAPPFSMQQYQQNQALKLLMLPSEMGSMIKAVAFTKNWDQRVRGFALFDKRKEL
jgi:SAM-dependent MidA family methyltransferase